MTSRALFWLLLQRLWSGVAVIPSLDTLSYSMSQCSVILTKSRNSDKVFIVTI